METKVRQLSFRHKTEGENHLLDSFQDLSQQKEKGNQVTQFTELYVWGCKFISEMTPIQQFQDDKYGQLGLGLNHQGKRYLVPKVCSYNLVIKQISCGVDHSAFITQKGYVYTIGSNSCGQLGVDNKDMVKTSSPSLVETLSRFACQKISCGSNHSVAILDNGEAFAWGSGLQGTLANNCDSNQWKPCKIEGFGEKFIDSSCGGRHTILINKFGFVYGAGSNKEGQLGIEGSEVEYALKQISQIPMSQVACGEDYTLFLSVQGSIYSTGSNKDGLLGIGHTISTKRLSQVDFKSKETITKIAAGKHSAALNSKGQLFVWGQGSFGQSLNPILFSKIDSAITDISIGSSFGMAIDFKGVVWCWGTNSGGELGVGDYEPRSNLFPISALKHKRVASISCGNNYIMALSTVKGTNIKDISSFYPKNKSFMKNQTKENPFSSQPKENSNQNDTFCQIQNQAQNEQKTKSKSLKRNLMQNSDQLNLQNTQISQPTQSSAEKQQAQHQFNQIEPNVKQKLLLNRRTKQTQFQQSQYSERKKIDISFSEGGEDDLKIFSRSVSRNIIPDNQLFISQKQYNERIEIGTRDEFPSIQIQYSSHINNTNSPRESQNKKNNIIRVQMNFDDSNDKQNVKQYKSDYNCSEESKKIIIQEFENDTQGGIELIQKMRRELSEYQENAQKKEIELNKQILIHKEKLSQFQIKFDQNVSNQQKLEELLKTELKMQIQTNSFLQNQNDALAKELLFYQKKLKLQSSSESRLTRELELLTTTIKDLLFKVEFNEDLEHRFNQQKKIIDELKGKNLDLSNLLSKEINRQAENIKYRTLRSLHNSIDLSNLPSQKIKIDQLTEDSNVKMTEQLVQLDKQPSKLNLSQQLLPPRFSNSYENLVQCDHRKINSDKPFFQISQPQMAQKSFLNYSGNISKSTVKLLDILNSSSYEKSLINPQMQSQKKMSQSFYQGTSELKNSIQKKKTSLSTGSFGFQKENKIL